MKFSIITPSYNSVQTISDTIESVIGQIHKDIEYLVIDGASTDKTIALIADYQKIFPIRLISEPDSGLYDAMNKGIKLATGEVIGILNSDDFYYDANVLAKINNIFETNQNVEAVYGDLVYVDKDNISKTVRYWQGGEYREDKINNGWIIPHPTFFVRKKVYDKCDKIFDTNFSLAADYELMLRLLKVNKIRVQYLPEILVKMRTGGKSSYSLLQRFRGWKELRLAWKVNSLGVPILFIVRRIINKLNQFSSLPKSKI